MTTLQRPIFGITQYQVLLYLKKQIYVAHAHGV